MVKKITTLRLIALPFASLFLLAASQYSSYIPGESPCPSVFTYEVENTVKGRWIGFLQVVPEFTLHGTWINIILDRQPNSLASSFGEVTTRDNKNFRLEDQKQTLTTGTQLQLRIQVDYNSDYSIPKLLNIHLNGREVCPPTPASTQSVHQGSRDTTYHNDGTHYSVPRRTINKESSNEAIPSQSRPNSGKRSSGISNNGRNTYEPESVYALSLVPRSNHNNVNRDQESVYSSRNEPDLSSKDSFNREPLYSSSRPAYSQNNSPNRDVYSQVSSNSNENHNYNVDTSGYERPAPIAPSRSQHSYDVPGHRNRETSNNPPASRPTVSNQNNGRFNDNSRGYQGTSQVNPLSPTISSDSYDGNHRGTSMTSTGTQTGRRTSAKNDYDNDSGDEDNVDVDPRPSTRKPSRQTESSDYFEGDHRLSNKDKINPTPTTFRDTSAEEESCGRVQVQARPLIVSGEIAQQGQWPWHVALYQSQSVDSTYICGGSLISLSHVLTAAHCVTRKSSERPVNAQTLTIYLGKFNLRKASDGVQIMLVRKIYVHPDYNASNFNADLAVLKFTKTAEYSAVVRPVCLWKESESDLSEVIDKEGSVVGWGFDESNNLQEELAMVKMPIVKQTTCLWSFKEFFTHFTSNHSFCAGYANGTSVCNGDSGGGMVFPKTTGYRSSSPTWYLRGLVSISVARQNEFTCDPYHYVVFTDVAQYISWIKRKIG